MRDRGSRIERLWDDWNSSHIEKHGVGIEEAEQALFGIPVVRETYKGRFQFIGPTVEGRVLTVIVGPHPETPGLYYVFSARPASRKERTFYEQQRRAQSEGNNR
jgi:uncharacterized DUF497 family protein